MKIVNKRLDRHALTGSRWLGILNIQILRKIIMDSNAGWGRSGWGDKIFDFLVTLLLLELLYRTTFFGNVLDSKKSHNV